MMPKHFSLGLPKRPFLRISINLLIPLKEGRIGPEHIHAELGEIVLGRRPGRETPEQVTLFKSVGLAVQDVVAAAAVLERAERLGLGTVAEL